MPLRRSGIRTLVIALSLSIFSAPALAQEPVEPTEDAADSTAAETEEEEADASDDGDAFQTVPDRPTFSAAAHSVAAGHAQFEIGGELSTTDDSTVLAFPVLARVGVADAFELRAGLPSFIVPVSGDGDPGLGSLQLAAKVAGSITDELSLGALPYFDIATATGDGETSFSQSTYGAVLLWGFSFTDAFGIGGNLGASVGPGSTEDAGPRELFYAASLTTGISVGDLGVTAEGFTIIAQYDDATAGGSLSLGYALFNKLVFDLYGGASSQANQATVFAGLGATVAR